MTNTTIGFCEHCPTRGHCGICGNDHDGQPTFVDHTDPEVRAARETAWLLNRCNPGAHSIRSIDVPRVIRRANTGILARIAQLW